MKALRVVGPSPLPYPSPRGRGDGRLQSADHRTDAASHCFERHGRHWWIGVGHLLWQRGQMHKTGWDIEPVDGEVVQELVGDLIAQKCPGTQGQFGGDTSRAHSLEHGAHWQRHEVGGWPVGYNGLINSLMNSVVSHTIVEEVDRYALNRNGHTPRGFAQTENSIGV